MVAVFGKNHFRTFKWFEIKHHLSFNILNLLLKDKVLCRNNKTGSWLYFQGQQEQPSPNFSKKGFPRVVKMCV